MDGAEQRREPRFKFDGATILVFDDQLDGGGNGGVLNITIDVAPPAPTIDVTVNPVGEFHHRALGAVAEGDDAGAVGNIDFGLDARDRSIGNNRRHVDGFAHRLENSLDIPARIGGALPHNAGMIADVGA